MTSLPDRREADIEAAFNRAVTRHGGTPAKFVSPGLAGVADRIVWWPEGVTTYAELKRPGEPLKPLQRSFQRKMDRLGHTIHRIENEQDIAKFIVASLQRVLKP